MFACSQLSIDETDIPPAPDVKTGSGQSVGLVSSRIPHCGGEGLRNSVSIKAEAISKNYIVILKEDIEEENFESHVQSVMSHHTDHMSASGTEDSTMDGLRERCCFGSFKSYYGAFHPDTLELIKNSPEVDFVEQDQVMRALDFVTQNDVPSWGLARISHKANGDLSTYSHPESAGEGVTAYIVDTGININHKDFGGRARWGTNTADAVNDDEAGHGTHVAGTVGGSTYGVAKNVSLVAVKVLGGNGSGTNTGVMKGIEWAVADAKSKGKSSKCVANMSLGGGYSAALNKTIKAATDSGITFVVAAGNESTDASTTSPASADSAITVGASDINDKMTSFSNFGPVVDVFAPGLNITSAWIGSNDATKTAGGTSMASPHVAGLAACFIADEKISGSKAVTVRIKNLATTGAVKGAPSGTTTRLVYNNSGK